MKTVAKRNLVSLGIMEGYFFRVKFFWKYCCQIVNFYIFVCLLYMGAKIFYIPRTFGISCPWLYGKVLLYVAIFLSELEKNIKRVVKSPSYLATTCRTSKKFWKRQSFGLKPSNYSEGMKIQQRKMLKYLEGKDEV